jgi:BON domain
MYLSLERGRRRASVPRMRPSLRRGRRRPGRRRERSALEVATVAVPAFAAGAALEFFLDQRSGRRRRRLVRDRAVAALRRRARKFERQGHYEAGKLVGLAHAITHRERAAPELDDISLVRKVESELFRDRSLPKGQISINSDRGIVVLRGQLEDAQQIQRIEREVRKVSGVRDVENLLHPAAVPAPASRPHGNSRAARRHA